MSTQEADGEWPGAVSAGSPRGCGTLGVGRGGFGTRGAGPGRGMEPLEWSWPGGAAAAGPRATRRGGMWEPGKAGVALVGGPPREAEVQDSSSSAVLTGGPHPLSSSGFSAFPPKMRPTLCEVCMGGLVHSFWSCRWLQSLAESFANEIPLHPSPPPRLGCWI